MPEVQRLLGVDIERPLAGNEDIVPLHLSTRSGDGRVQGTRPQAMNDRAWAVAFKLNVAITVISAVYFHKTALTALGDFLESSGWSWLASRSGAGAIVLSCILAVPCSYALSGASIEFMTSFPALSVNLSMGILWLECVLVFLLAALELGISGVALLPVLAMVFAVITGLFLSRRGRVEFATANFKVAALAVKATPQIMYMALCTLAFRIVWLVVVGSAWIGSVIAVQTVLAPDGTTYRAVDCHTVPPSVLTHLSCECNGNIISESSGCEHSKPNVFLACFWVVSLTWGFVVTVNVMIATVADSVTTWWSSPSDLGTVWVSFHRVIHSSLGSVSKAAVIVGFLSLLQYVVDKVLLAIWAMACPLICGRMAVDYMMENTVSFIGMSRLSFSEAAHRTWPLFRKHGFTLYINDVLAAGGVFFVSLTGLTISLVIVRSLPSLSMTLLVMVMSIYGAVVLTIIAALDVVISALKAVCTCFLQNPEAFSASHDRQLYDGMYRAWRKMKLSHPTMPEDQGVTQV